jgi:hypothetical protein
MLAGTSTVAYFECARIDALTWYYSDMRDKSGAGEEKPNGSTARVKLSCQAGSERHERGGRKRFTTHMHSKK